MAGIRYSVHAWGWSLLWNDDALPLIDKAKELGFDALEIPVFVPDQIDAAATKARARAAGITILCCLGCFPNADPASEDEETRARALEYLKKRIQVTADMGGVTLSGTIYAAGGRLKSPLTEEHYERSASVLRETARFASELGITLGLEAVNRYEGYLVNTADQALKLREMIGEPNVGVHLDSSHMAIDEDSYYEATLKAAPHLVHYHMCENHRGELGTGLVDFDSIYRALAESGYSGFAGLEFFGPPMAPLAGLWRRAPEQMDEVSSRSLAFLKGLEAKHHR